MKCSDAEYADIVIDGKPYRVETLREWNYLQKLHYGRKGIVFPDPKTSSARLDAEDMAERETLRV